MQTTRFGRLQVDMERTQPIQDILEFRGSKIILKNSGILSGVERLYIVEKFYDRLSNETRTGGSNLLLNMTTNTILVAEDPFYLRLEKELCSDSERTGYGTGKVYMMDNLDSKRVILVEFVVLSPRA